MWSISDLKSRAWNLLRGTYWKSFLTVLLVSLVLMLIGKVFDAGDRLLDALMGVHAASGGIWTGLISDRMFGPFLSKVAAIPVWSFFWLLALTASLLLSLVRDFLVNSPAEVGLCRFFMRARQGSADMNGVLYPFQNRFANVVKISFFQTLFISLWTLLLIIPGIIKSYEYYMIPYILSENPGIDRKRAFQLSRAMTDGEKWNIFVLELSFIGWYLLSILTFGIGLFFLEPYVRATKAELYAALRDKAFYLGAAAPQDLPGYTNGSGDSDFYRQ